MKTKAILIIGAFALLSFTYISRVKEKTSHTVKITATKEKVAGGLVMEDQE